MGAEPLSCGAHGARWRALIGQGDVAGSLGFHRLEVRRHLPTARSTKEETERSDRERGREGEREGERVSRARRRESACRRCWWRRQRASLASRATRAERRRELGAGGVYSRRRSVESKAGQGSGSARCRGKGSVAEGSGWRWRGAPAAGSAATAGGSRGRGRGRASSRWCAASGSSGELPRVTFACWTKFGSNRI